MRVVTLPGLLSVEEAVERLKALEAVDSSNAFEMGDIVLSAVPMVETERDKTTEGQAFAGSAGLFKDQGVTEALKDIADKAGMSWTTLSDRRFVASRIVRGQRGERASYKVYRALARVQNESERVVLLELVRQPNPDREDGRWTEAALRPHLPKRAGTGSEPEVASDPAEQALDQACRAIDYLLMHNDIERLERFRTYWHRQVPEKLQALDWWGRKEEERFARAEALEARRQAKQKAS